MRKLEHYNKGLIYTDINKCIDCNKCIHECPILKSNVSVKDENDNNRICVDDNECILCGKCIDTCIHDARLYKDDFGSFLVDLVNGRQFSVLVAPSFYLIYPDSYKQILGYLKTLGVNKFYSVGFGADITTWGYINYIAKNNATGLVSQPCPCIVSHIEKHQPSLLPQLIPVQSPMMCAAIYLKKYMNITDDLVFLGPCIAKKVEIESKRGLGLIKHNVTFNSLLEHISVRNIDLSSCPATEDELVSIMGAVYPSPGGLKANVEYFMEHDAGVMQVEGEHRIYDYLQTLTDSAENQFMPMLIDALNCERGCSYGTGTSLRNANDYSVAYQSVLVRKNNYKKLRGQNELNNRSDRMKLLNNTFKDLELKDFLCEYDHESKIHTRTINSHEIDDIFENKLMKRSENDKNVNCSACGYKSCHHMAEAIAHGINHRENCVYYVKNTLAHSVEEIKTAVEQNQVKSKFLARMSHELRTPLSAVLGISEIQLQNSNIPLDIEEAFSKIYSSANTLLGIVNDILDLSKVESGKMELIKTKYEVASLVSDVVQLNLINIGSKKIDFSVDIDENMPAYLIGDELRIKQVLNNMLSNAFKYTDSGYVSFKMYSTKGKSENHETIIIVVQDTGRGMDEEQQKRLFNEYERFHEREDRFMVGTGLGMSIALSLLVMMDGAIDVDSTLGSGTVITITLPQEKCSDELLGTETANNLRHFNTDMRANSKRISFVPEKMPYGRVLVVDDVSTNIYVAKGLMGLYGIQIDSCESGLIAIEKIVDGEIYDIIFMDHMMPKMNGIEAAGIIRSLGYSKPIIALTANALIGQADEFLANGFDGFLSKPIQSVHLNAILHKYIKEKYQPSTTDEFETVMAELESLPETQDTQDTPPLDDYLLLPEIAAQIRADFIDNHSNIVNEIIQEVSDGDIPTAHRQAHTLAVLAEMLNEPKFAKIARNMETILKEGTVPTKDKLDVLKNEMQLVLTRLKDLM